MKKTILSCVAVLSLCVSMPVMADVDETFMDWSYASGLDPKPRPTTQERYRNRADFISHETTNDVDVLDADIFATSEVGQLSTTHQDTNINSSEYVNLTYSTTQDMAHNNAGYNMNETRTAQTQSWNNAGYNTADSANAYTQNSGTGHVSANPQYYQVPIQTIQTPAEIHRVNNPVTVQYPVTKQYPISMQYPVTIQKEITVQRPVVVQQPIVVQRPIVMQQPVMVQHQPLMVQNKPLMVQQQPTVVQKQPIVVNAPAPAPITSPVSCTMGCPVQMPQVNQQMMPVPTTQHIPVQVKGTFSGMGMGMVMPTANCNNGCAN